MLVGIAIEVDVPEGLMDGEGRTSFAAIESCAYLGKDPKRLPYASSLPDP